MDLLAVNIVNSQSLDEFAKMQVRQTPPRGPPRKEPPGFDLTLFDMVGRFETDVGEW